ncbi:MAG: sarcosine oxidase subunit gamma family protein, partial [Pseudomonadota bacterium]
MTDSLTRTALQSPSVPAGLAVAVQELPLRGMLSMRGDLANPAIAAAVQMAVGQTMPGPLGTSGDGTARVLWMSPDELLLMLPHREAAEKTQVLRQSLTGHVASVTDVSDARQVFEVKGEGAREVLAKGTPIDLHPAAFRLGQFRRTRVGAVAAGLYLTADSPD